MSRRGLRTAGCTRPARCGLPPLSRTHCQQGADSRAKLAFTDDASYAYDLRMNDVHFSGERITRHPVQNEKYT